jgi:hypothetical protein
MVFPLTIIRGPFLKITMRISSGGAASGCGPQPDWKITAASSACSNFETNSCAASATFLGAVGESQTTIFVPKNFSSDPIEEGGGDVSSFQLAVPNNWVTQLRTPSRSGSEKSVTKAYRCPANRCSGGTNCGIRARSGVRQDMLAASCSRAMRSSSASLRNSAASFSFAVARSLASDRSFSNWCSCDACRLLTISPATSAPNPTTNVKNSSRTAPTSNTDLNHSAVKDFAKEFLHECLTDPESRVYAVLMLLSLIGFIVSAVYACWRILPKDHNASIFSRNSE